MLLKTIRVQGFKEDGLRYRIPSSLWFLIPEPFMCGSLYPRRNIPEGSRAQSRRSGPRDLSIFDTWDFGEKKFEYWL